MPQDGRISIKIDDRGIDFRVSTVPAKFGEKIVMRILDKSGSLLPLDQDDCARPDGREAALDDQSALRHHLRHRSDRFRKDDDAVQLSERNQFSGGQYFHGGRSD